MRSTSVFSIAALLLGCALLPDRSAAAEQAPARSDPITTLVERLSASHVWKNGMYPNLGLPGTASTDEVIARVFEMTSFQEGPAKRYRILETSLVQIPESLPYPTIAAEKTSKNLPYTYIAALVRTEFGEKIVLLKYRDLPTGWWSRVYDARPESVPSLRLHVDGAADPSTVRVEYMLAGPFGGFRSQLRGSANIDIPIVIDGQPARSLRAIVFCPGYRIARVEIPDLVAQTDLRVALDALPVRRVTGKVEFVGNAVPRSFVLGIDVMVASSREFFGIVDGSLTTFDVTEAVVSSAGDFSVAIADLAEDRTLQSAHESSVFRFMARDAATGNFVFELKPKKIAIEELLPALVLSASPPR